MATNVLRNNFTSGIVSQRLWGQYNSSYYLTGCSKLNNFIIHPQGGVERRYPTKDVAQMYGKRIIPFVIDEHNSYMIEICGGSPKYFRVWKQYNHEEPTIVKFDSGTKKESATGDVTQLLEGSGTGGIGFNLYTDAQAQDIQFAQGVHGNNLMLVMVHKNFQPVVFEYSVSSSQMKYPKQVVHSGNQSYQQACTFAVNPDTEQEHEDTVSLFLTNYNPSVVFYYASRLWFAGSINEPYKLWSSWATEPFNFKVCEYEPVVNDVTTSEDIIEKIETGGQYEVTPTVEYVEVEREDTALVLQLGSSNNDRIMWMSAISNNIIVGTASSEWIMSGAINGLTQSAYQASAYGSSFAQPVMANNDLLFLQQGSRKIRSYIGSTSGYSCPDLTFQCDSILSQGVKRMCFMRVPEPTLFCLLNNGKLAVLFYDRTYSLQGWANWELKETIYDICVVNTDIGQRVFVITDRTNSSTTVKRLEYFDEGRTTYKDGLNYPNTGDGVGFDSELDTITYERTSSTDGSSIGKKKRIYEANLRTLDSSKGSVGYYSGSGTSSIYTQNFSSQNNAWGVDDVKVSLAGGFEKYVAFKLKSVDTNPLTVDAISLFTEVE